MCVTNELPLREFMVELLCIGTYTLIHARVVGDFLEWMTTGHTYLGLSSISYYVRPPSLLLRIEDCYFPLGNVSCYVDYLLKFLSISTLQLSTSSWIVRLSHNSTASENLTYLVFQAQFRHNGRQHDRANLPFD